jgi:sporulation protein YtfJ
LSKPAGPAFFARSRRADADERPIRENQQINRLPGGILAFRFAEALMDPQQVLSTAQEALSVRRVFGDPIDIGGTTIVPVARVSGGGGGGGRGTEEGGVGYGVNARPVGVYVIRDGDARWRPAIDVNRVILGGQLVAATALAVLGPAIARWLTRHAA